MLSRAGTENGHERGETAMSTIAEHGATQSQKLMVFVLSMSLYGLATLISELIPSVQIGIVELSVEFFLFIPLTLAMLFDPLSAALGAATGELVFSEIMLGQFGGLGELEKFLTVTIAVYIAGLMVRDPKSTKQVAIAAISGPAIQLAMSAVVDIVKVQVAVEDFEAVAGLPESVFATEGFAFANDLLFSGILFCLLPTMFLVPRLYGKIEPLLGCKPRSADTAAPSVSGRVIGWSAAGFIVAVVVACVSKAGLSIIEWEADWAESQTALFAGIAVAAVIAVVAAFWAYRTAQLRRA